ncbi:1,6-anhydro-N-acetylmuramyl-L-alanine amidase AmpD [Pseudohongiella sp.]|uniref:1,6-anhydro-N-acetylmuramyl-L-alanine amidase AmpD n=1 Tax=Pseudohongiella sp. TaxID=1979412 RepID=UPI0017FDD520|nr:1,6-anhydro-N-acetylmuramyl-L-alanine amidase AmpD [Pseudohongiella sp.]HDZ10395.1 1,6-anhydro-N-acetylmuramyl-L-alanine amidase AmpD [Pseudohongiella sp.]HEA61982.1 1,6-anhydro-N-acetylmuramyl-L-alanine amidase AmpD [Pseudohongiella sp.]
MHNSTDDDLHRDLPDARYVASPNFSERPAGVQVDVLVIHNISLPPGEFGGSWIDDLFCNQLDPTAHPYFRDIADLRVSAHALIDRLGQLTQYVAFDKKAWHAGQSSFDGRPQCNDFAIGVELEGCDDQPFTDAQYRCLGALTRHLQEVYPAITPDRIVGHSDIAPGRKTDPGPCFDWRRYKKDLT